MSPGLPWVDRRGICYRTSNNAAFMSQWFGTDAGFNVKQPKVVLLQPRSACCELLHTLRHGVSRLFRKGERLRSAVSSYPRRRSGIE